MKIIKASPLFPLLVVLYEIAVYLSNDAYVPAMPHIATQLSASYHLLQLTITICFLGSAISQLFLGPISDHFGRRLVVLLGGMVFLASTLTCGLSHSITVLLIARFVQGISAIIDYWRLFSCS